MFNKKIETQLNGQLNKELYAMYLYLSMAAYADSIGLGGIAQWFRAQSAEEFTHAMKIYNFINDKGGRVILEAIKQPKSDFKSVKQLFELALEHEQLVTDSINKLVEIAAKEKEHATASFLRWFVDEQVEEEASVMGILDKFTYIGDSGMGLIMLDRELANRK
jgi:ferritin